MDKNRYEDDQYRYNVKVGMKKPVADGFVLYHTNMAERFIDLEPRHSKTAEFGLFARIHIMATGC